MAEREPLPLSLKVVGLLLLLLGLNSAARMPWDYWHGRWTFEVGVIAAPMGVGLWIRSSEAFWCAWVYTLLCIALGFLGVVIAAFAPGPIPNTFFGWEVPGMPRIGAFLVSLGWLAVGVWANWILARQESRALFRKPVSPASESMSNQQGRASSKPRRFQFSLARLFLLVTIVSLACALGHAGRARYFQEDQTVRELEELLEAPVSAMRREGLPGFETVTFLDVSADMDQIDNEEFARMLELIGRFPSLRGLKRYHDGTRGQISGEISQP